MANPVCKVTLRAELGFTIDGVDHWLPAIINTAGRKHIGEVNFAYNRFILSTDSVTVDENTLGLTGDQFTGLNAQFEVSTADNLPAEYTDISTVRSVFPGVIATNYTVIGIGFVAADPPLMCAANIPAGLLASGSVTHLLIRISRTVPGGETTGTAYINGSQTPFTVSFCGMSTPSNINIVAPNFGLARSQVLEGRYALLNGITAYSSLDMPQADEYVEDTCTVVVDAYVDGSYEKDVTYTIATLISPSKSFEAFLIYTPVYPLLIRFDTPLTPGNIVGYNITVNFKWEVA